MDLLDPQQTQQAALPAQALAMLHMHWVAVLATNAGSDLYAAAMAAQGVMPPWPNDPKRLTLSLRCHSFLVSHWPHRHGT